MTQPPEDSRPSSEPDSQSHSEPNAQEAVMPQPPGVLTDRPLGIPTPPAFRDRRTAMMIFGVILILIGAGAGCMSLLMPLSFLAPVESQAPEGLALKPSAQTILPSMVLYAMVAAGFIALGVGSIRCRRWAPPVVVAAAWIWLIAGVLGVAMICVVGPGLLQDLASQFDDEVNRTVIYVIASVAGCAMLVESIALPTMLLLFYRSVHVRQTCIVNDPKPRWTDDSPSGIVTLAMAMGLLAAMMLPSVATAKLPMFGKVISGFPASVVVLVIVVASAVLAWGVSRKAIWAWWGTAAFLAVATAAPFVTMLTMEPRDYYRKLAPDEQTAAFMEEIDVSLMHHVTIAVIALLAVATVVYLLKIRKHFVSAS